MDLEIAYITTCGFASIYFEIETSFEIESKGDHYHGPHKSKLPP